tara:strand:- start:696 stop:977 length:282 start_codon:yes stop_codon:yes gene_type:complete
MGNYFSSDPVENSDNNSELKIFKNDSIDIICNDKNTQTSDNLDYNVLLKKFNQLENEKNIIQDELSLLKQKYESLIIKLDSEQFIKQIIKKIN